MRVPQAHVVANRQYWTTVPRYIRANFCPYGIHSLYTQKILYVAETVSLVSSEQSRYTFDSLLALSSVMLMNIELPCELILSVDQPHVLISRAYHTLHLLIRVVLLLSRVGLGGNVNSEGDLEELSKEYIWLSQSFGFLE